MKRPANDGNNATSMKALVYHGAGIRAWEDRPKPTIMEATDAIVRITTTTLCGTDLRILKGDVPTVTNGRILGHEGVGIIEEQQRATLHFGDMNVERRGEQHVFEVQVCLHDLDPKAVRVEVSANGVNGGAPVRQEMQRLRPLTGASGGYMYSAAVSAARPPAWCTRCHATRGAGRKSAWRWR